MRDVSGWTIGLGRWCGVQVRLHALFFLFAALLAASSTAANPLPTLWAIAVLLASIAWREGIALVVAAKAGARPESTVWWPAGAFRRTLAAQEPQQELLAALAGPMANLLLCLMLGAALLVTDQSLVHLSLFAPPAWDWATWPGMAASAFWINWVLLLVNLLPAVPLDGGWVVRASAWRWLDYRGAVTFSCRLTQLTALVLAVSAFLIRDPGQPLIWAGWLLLAICLWFRARQELDELPAPESHEAPFGYDFSQGYTSLERSFEHQGRPPVGPIRRWLLRRRQLRLQRQMEQELLEERRVDEILSRLHQYGNAALSEADRAVLERVSQRYRSRNR